jgi:hypothetical protein
MNSSQICGSCTMCCKLLGIGGDEFRSEPFRKPAGEWCPHCAIGQGCKVYAERPATCRSFQCLYLQGMLRGEPLPPDFRPDRCGVVISPTTDGQLVASVDPHKIEAWQRGTVAVWLRAAVRAGFRVTISTGPSLKKLLLQKRGREIVIEEAEFTPPDDQGMQWSIPGSNRRVGIWRAP